MGPKEENDSKIGTIAQMGGGWAAVKHKKPAYLTDSKLLGLMI